MEELPQHTITQKGLAQAKKEYAALTALKNAKTQDEVPAMLHSEELDPDYQAFQEDMELLEKRLVELKEVIENAHVIRRPLRENQDIVQPGATVLLEIDGEHEDTFTIVGSFCADPKVGTISNESPVGKALLGCKVGDVVTLSSPIKTIYKVKRIRYA